MNYKQKLFYAVAGFLIGNILLTSLVFGIYSIANYQTSKNEISFDEARQRLQSKDIKEINIKGNTTDFSVDERTKYAANVSDKQKEEILKNMPDGITVNLESNSRSPFEKLFQVLFVLFIISPPIIVVLLLIIIKKMKSNDSIR